MTFKGGRVDVMWQLVRAVDLAAHITVLVAPDLMTEVYNEVLAENFHLIIPPYEGVHFITYLNLLRSEERCVKSDFPFFGRVRH
jgi:hypothetical protein